MNRDLALLADTHFDLVVVGAGIYGAALAWDAAQRGLAVAVIDRGDFGGATSFNSLKTVHGGLRSLQRAAFGDMREFIRERRTLARIAPHLVHPLPFVVPTYRHIMRNAPLMRAVVAVNDFVGRDRNALADPSKHLPGGRVVSREECLRLNPAIDPGGVTGGAVWYDCQMYSADRVTLSFLLSAAGAGAAAANYVEATGFLAGGKCVTGVRVRDCLAGGAFDIRARLVVNAAGPWTRSLLDLMGARRPGLPAHGFSRAMNLVVGPVDSTHGLGGLVDGRFLFLAPWRDCAIIGTSHDAHAGGADDLSVGRRDVERFLAEARRAFPRADLRADSVRLVHRGLLPSAPGAGGHDRLLKQSLVVDHARDDLDGLISVLGVRFTTARATAARAVDLACDKLGVAAPCRTAETPLAGGDIERWTDYEHAVLSAAPAALPPAALARLVRCYGTGHAALTTLIEGAPALGAPLSSECPVTRAEIVHAARHEMAVRLTDAIIRRTDAGSAGHPGRQAVCAAAEVMAQELGWTPSRIEEEIDQVDRFYRIAD